MKSKKQYFPTRTVSRMARKILALLLILSVIIPAKAATSDPTIIKDNLSYDAINAFSEGYAVVKKGSKYGLVDSNGKEIVAPKYDYVANVSGGMAVVGNNTDGDTSTGGNSGGNGIDKYGYINTRGQEIVSLKYDFAYSFYDGLAAVGYYYEHEVKTGDLLFPAILRRDANLGFIDNSGKEVIPLTYEDCAQIVHVSGSYDPKGFSEGAASVCKNGKWGAIDKSGKTIVPFTFESLNSFHDGLASYRSGNSGGFVNKSGKTVISGYLGWDFYDGRCVVWKYTSGDYKYGVIDTAGKIIVPFSYDSISNFSEGMARVSNEQSNGTRKYGFVDTAGKLIVPVIYDGAEDSSNGLALVYSKDERFTNTTQYKYGYVDKSGKIVIPLQFSLADSFSGGVASVAVGVPDHHGNGSDAKINARFKEMGISPEYSCIDTTGKKILSFGAERVIASFSDNIGVLKYSSGKSSIVKNTFYSGASNNVGQASSSDSVTASPTSSTVLINGVKTSFDAYYIDGNNYFKLRDVAQALRGSRKQFEVSWDSAAGAINMISNKAYTTVGGEMNAGDGKTKTGTVNTAPIYLNGKAITLSAYNIGGNNYFKLRDIGKTFDFDVSWDGARNTIVVDTAKSYTDD